MNFDRLTPICTDDVTSMVTEIDNYGQGYWQVWLRRLTNTIKVCQIWSTIHDSGLTHIRLWLTTCIDCNVIVTYVYIYTYCTTVCVYFLHMCDVIQIPPLSSLSPPLSLRPQPSSFNQSAPTTSAEINQLYVVTIVLSRVGGNKSTLRG